MKQYGQDKRQHSSDRPWRSPYGRRRGRRPAATREPAIPEGAQQGERSRDPRDEEIPSLLTGPKPQNREVEAGDVEQLPGEDYR
jgi:hypothetical protein